MSLNFIPNSCPTYLDNQHFKNSNENVINNRASASNMPNSAKMK